MAGTFNRRSVLVGIGIGVLVGVVVGLVGGLLDWPIAVRGGVMGAMLVIGFALVRRVSSARKSQA